MTRRRGGAVVHELSEPGARPLCGAPVEGARPPSPEAPIDCPACLRLLADDTRRAAHVARPRRDESED